MDWTLEGARDHWMNLLERADDNDGYKKGCAFLKGVIDCTQSVRVFDGDDNDRLLQYKDFIKYVNTLNLVEKIHPTGKIETLAKKILEQVPGFWVLNENSERILSSNFAPLPGPSLTDNHGVVESAPQVGPLPDVPLLDNATDKQGELDSAPEVATVPDVPLLDDTTKSAGHTTVEAVGDVSSVPDKNLLGSDVGAAEGQAVPSINVTSVPDKTLLQDKTDTIVDPTVRDTSGLDKSPSLEADKEKKAAPTAVQETSVPDEAATTTLQETSVPEIPLLVQTVPEETSLVTDKVAAEGSKPTEDVETVRHDDNDDDDDDMEWDGVTTPGKNTDPRKIATSNQPIVGSAREYWENVIFPEHAIAKNTIGFDFLEDLLAGKTSITDSGEPRRVHEQQYRQLINLYNSLNPIKKNSNNG